MNQDYLDWRHFRGAGRRIRRVDHPRCRAPHRDGAQRLRGRTRQLRCRASGPPQPARYSATTSRARRRSGARSGSSRLLERRPSVCRRSAVKRQYQVWLARLASVVAIVVLRHRGAAPSSRRAPADQARRAKAHRATGTTRCTHAAFRQTGQITVHGHAVGAEICGRATSGGSWRTGRQHRHRSARRAEPRESVSRRRAEAVSHASSIRSVWWRSMSIGSKRSRCVSRAGSSELDVRAVGDSVRRGQRLAGVYAPDLLATQQELLIARNSR